MAQARPVALEDRLAAFREEYGDTVPIERIVPLVQALLPAIEAPPEGETARLGTLVDSLSRAENELSALRPRHLSRRQISDARAELDAVVAHTERAASSFMDVGEQLSDLAETLGGDAGATAAALSTAILEASSFQDITGQRVSKVLGILGVIEARLAALADAIGDEDAGEADAPAAVFDESGEVINADALKHGPQQEGEGNSQEEIDAILASFD